MAMKPDMKILVVDDMATMRHMVKYIFKQLGFTNIEGAENGKDALDKLKAGKFDLVVSDWNMPVMPGIELLKNIRADASLKHIPVLMVTAEAQKDNLMEAIQAGVSNYIAKPFTAETIKQKLDKIFA